MKNTLLLLLLLLMEDVFEDCKDAILYSHTQRVFKTENVYDPTQVTVH